MSAPYDPYIPNESASPQPQQNNKTQRVQNQVNEVVGIMQDNIDQMYKRGETLNSLQNKTEDLHATSSQFRRGANQVRKRMWWKDLKWKIIIAVTILIILGAIIGSIVGTQTNKGGDSSPPPAPAPSP